MTTPDLISTIKNNDPPRIAGPERSEVDFVFWVNRKGRYPYVDTQTWTTRVWLLLRKVQRQQNVSSLSDRRVAIELLRLRPRGVANHLVEYLEEILSGCAEERPYRASDAPEAGLGEDAGGGSGGDAGWQRH